MSHPFVLGYDREAVPVGEVLDHRGRPAGTAGPGAVPRRCRGRRDPSFGATARGAASYAGHTEIVALIDEWLAAS